MHLPKQRNNQGARVPRVTGDLKTQCQDEVRILSGRTQKLKVAKRCWKQRNEHNLMYIYHKQCENMQKIQ